VLLRSIAPGAGAIEVLQNGVDVAFWRPPPEPVGSLDVVFCGVMDYPPNEQAAAWLVSAVWPSVLARCPQAHLWLVGSSPTRRLVDLGASARSVTVTGTVPDVRPFLWKAAVAAAPLGVSRGVQNKVLEAVAGGLPAVVTPAVAAGLPPEILPACAVAGPAAAFSEAILSLLAATPGERRAIARTASLERLDWTSRLAPLLLAVEEEAGGAASRTS
jgi:glycosyltransferase involved in cell wall biosynthesis